MEKISVTEEVISETDLGDQVFCDACGEDYTESDEEGGFEFGRKAYCPKCAEATLPKIEEYDEMDYIKSWCPEGMSYRDWVVNVLRGGKPGTIKVISIK